MSRYCSLEARRVVETIEEYGLTVADYDYFGIEIAIGKFWNTHIQKVIVGVMQPSTRTTAEEKLKKAQEGGWAYFAKPIWSMLIGRGAAHRHDDFEIIDDEWTRTVYNLLCTRYVVADFNMRELALLTLELPRLISDVATISQYIDAARRGGSRNIYYLHGIAKRENDAKQGRLKEIQESLAQGDNGWTPPLVEELDIVEAKLLEARWKQRLNEIQISTALNNV